MQTRLALALSMTAGIVVGALLMQLLTEPSDSIVTPVLATPLPSQAALPRSREQAIVLSWLFEHRADAPDLEILRWSTPSPVARNPFTQTPATLVRLVVKNHGMAEAKLEHLSFYLRDFEVLGSISKAYAEPEVTSAA